MSVPEMPPAAPAMAPLRRVPSKWYAELSLAARLKLLRRAHAELAAVLMYLRKVLAEEGGEVASKKRCLVMSDCKGAMEAVERAEAEMAGGSSKKQVKRQEVNEIDNKREVTRRAGEGYDRRAGLGRWPVEDTKIF